MIVQDDVLEDLGFNVTPGGGNAGARCPRADVDQTSIVQILEDQSLPVVHNRLIIGRLVEQHLIRLPIAVGQISFLRFNLLPAHEELCPILVAQAIGVVDVARHLLLRIALVVQENNRRQSTQAIRPLAKTELQLKT